MLLSVIIVAYNNAEDIHECLESIEKFNDLNENAEIIVVDNSSNDDVYNLVVNNYSYVNLVRSENVGFGAGNNKGAKIAKGKYLLFLNPDTELVEPVFKKCVSKFESDPDIKIMGVKLITTNGSPTFSYQFIDRYGVIYNQLIKVFNRINTFVNGAMFIMGADLFVRKVDFVKAGMFDENIFMYNEEADLTKRIYRLYPKAKTMYIPELRIIHKEGKNCDDFQHYKIRLEIGYESEKYYCTKYKLDFKRRIAARIRYEKMKEFIYFITRQNEKKEFQKQIISYFKTTSS